MRALGRFHGWLLLLSVSTVSACSLRRTHGHRDIGGTVNSSADANGFRKISATLRS